MQEFRYLSYHTEYSYDGDFTGKMKAAACFGTVFNHVSRNKASSLSYIIRIYPGDTLKRYSLSNMCFFNKAQIKNHINQLKSLFPIKFRVYEGKGKYGKCFEVELSLENLPGICHKYALTWVRYLYEYPYNVVLLEAYKLKEDPLFRFESIANLFNLISSCSSVYAFGNHGIAGHSSVKLLRRKELAASLQAMKCSQLNNLYESSSGDEEHTISSVLGKYDDCDIEYWQSPEGFEKRKAVYIEQYTKRYIKTK